MTTVSVVIPVFNSEACLPGLCDQLVSVLEKCEPEFEIVFVDDCSKDDSWVVIRKLCVKSNRIRGLRLSRNFGQHNALLCGIRAAQGDVIITMDDDLQHPPTVLPDLLKKYHEGYDVVYGAPISEPHSLFRGLASRITKWVLQNAIGAENATKVSALRVFKGSLKEAFRDYRSPYVNIDVMLTWGTTNFSYLHVEHHERALGKSGYTVNALIRHALNMMTGFSTLPLQIASFTGFIFAFFGLLVLIYVIGRYLISGAVVPGFAFLGSIIAIFSGAQLLALGIIGEYIARIHFRSMERPPYNIDTRI